MFASYCKGGGLFKLLSRTKSSRALEHVNFSHRSKCGISDELPKVQISSPALETSERACERNAVFALTLRQVSTILQLVSI